MAYFRAGCIMAMTIRAEESDSFSRQMFMEHLFCARHCSRQGSRGEQDRQGPSLMGHHLLSQTDNKQRCK